MGTDTAQQAVGLHIVERRVLRRRHQIVEADDLRKAVGVSTKGKQTEGETGARLCVYILVTEVAEEFDFTQNALGIDQVLEGARHFLDGDLQARAKV